MRVERCVITQIQNRLLYFISFFIFAHVFSGTFENLQWAVTNNDLEAVQKILREEEVNLEASSPHECFLWAALLNNSFAVACCLARQRCIKVDIRDEYGSAPIHYAIGSVGQLFRKKDISILKRERVIALLDFIRFLLIRDDIDPKIKDDNGCNPLHLIFDQWFSAAEALGKQDNDLPMWSQAILEIVFFLMMHPLTNLDEEDGNGETVLCKALKIQKHTVIVDMKATIHFIRNWQKFTREPTPQNLSFLFVQDKLDQFKHDVKREFREGKRKFVSAFKKLLGD